MKLKYKENNFTSTQSLGSSKHISIITHDCFKRCGIKYCKTQTLITKAGVGDSGS